MHRHSQGTDWLVSKLASLLDNTKNWFDYSKPVLCLTMVLTTKSPSWKTSLSFDYSKGTFFRAYSRIGIVGMIRIILPFWT